MKRMSEDAVIVTGMVVFSIRYSPVLADINFYPYHFTPSVAPNSLDVECSYTSQS